MPEVNPAAVLAPSKLHDIFRGIPMHGITAVRTWSLDAARAGFVALATALILTAAPAPAAPTPPTPGSETRITLTPFPPSVQVDASTADDADADSGSVRSKRHRAVIRLDSDRDFESFKDAVRTAPWIVGLAFLIVGSIFLTPVILLIGIVWYKLRKTRMQNEALLRLAEKGALPPAQAADAVTSGVMPASAAAGVAGDSSTGTVYHAAAATRRWLLVRSAQRHPPQRVRAVSDDVFDNRKQLGQLAGTHAVVRRHRIHRSVVVRGPPHRPTQFFRRIGLTPRNATDTWPHPCRHHRSATLR
jgi:hypothetical protein